MLVESFEAVVPTDYHQLPEPAQSDGIPHDKFPEFNLAVFGGQTVRVNVGTRASPVNLALELHDSPPSYDAAEWEDAAEGDVYYDNPGGLAIWGLEYGGFEQAIPETPGTTITRPGQHRYRVRIYARGKDIDYDAPHLGDPVENYLIQMWPTDQEEEPRQMKNLSGR